MSAFDDYQTMRCTPAVCTGIFSVSFWADVEFTMPESVSVIDIIKLWQGMTKWEWEQKQEVGTQESVWIDVQR